MYHVPLPLKVGDWLHPPTPKSGSLKVRLKVDGRVHPPFPQSEGHTFDLYPNDLYAIYEYFIAINDAKNYHKKVFYMTG